MFADYDNDGFRDLGEPNALTASNGRYELKNAAFAPVQVRLEYAPGFRQTATPQTVTLLPGQTRNYFNFRIEETPIVPQKKVTGVAFNDTNGNGHYDDGEPKVKSGTRIDIFAGSPSGTPIGNAWLDSTGHFAAYLAPGTYHLRSFVGRHVWDGGNVPLYAEATVAVGPGGLVDVAVIY
ncbi:MAG: hypothetical protein QM770_13620 [Tepidisphaeraceae bacterium]